MTSYDSFANLASESETDVFMRVEEAIASLPHSQFRRLLIEVTDAKVLSLDHNIDGLIARGHESGGWVGEDSALILTQKLLSIQPLPV
jgi:hypothetical protein